MEVLNKKRLAFPESCTSDGHRGNVDNGMTLRDYFASKALNIVPFITKEYYENREDWTAEDYANEAYTIADEMLKRREI